MMGWARTRRRTFGFLGNMLDQAGYPKNSQQDRRLNHHKISSRKSTKRLTKT